MRSFLPKVLLEETNEKPLVTLEEEQFSDQIEVPQGHYVHVGWLPTKVYNLDFFEHKNKRSRKMFTVVLETDFPCGFQVQLHLKLFWKYLTFF